MAMRIDNQNVVLELLAGMPRRTDPASTLIAAIPPAGPAPASSLVLAFAQQIPHAQTSFERIDAARRRRLDVRA